MPRTGPEQRPPRGLPPDTSTVAGLVADLRQGSVDALARVYDELAPGVYGLARRLTDDSATAETLTAHVFTHLWQEAGTLDSRHPDVAERVREHLRTGLLALRQDATPA